MYGQFQDGAEYSFAEAGYFLSSNEYLLIAKNYSAKCLLAFLNSKVSEWLLGNITGSLGDNAKIGQKSNFLKLSVAKLKKEQQQEFDSIIDVILNNKNSGQDTTSLEKRIDEMIFAIYKLLPQEIQEIERL